MTLNYSIEIVKADKEDFHSLEIVKASGDYCDFA